MATKRLDAARAVRTKTTSAAVAGLVAKRPAATGSTDTVRTNVVVSRDLALRADERLLELKRAGSPTSWSGLVEVALTELLEREDLAETVSRYGLGLRRK